MVCLWACVAFCFRTQHAVRTTSANNSYSAKKTHTYIDYTYRYQCSVLLLILFVAAVTDVCGLQQCGCMQIAYHVCGTHMAHIDILCGHACCHCPAIMAATSMHQGDRYCIFLICLGHAYAGMSLCQNIPVRCFPTWSPLTNKLGLRRAA